VTNLILNFNDKVHTLVKHIAHKHDVVAVVE